VAIAFSSTTSLGLRGGEPPPDRRVPSHRVHHRPVDHDDGLAPLLGLLQGHRGLRSGGRRLFGAGGDFRERGGRLAMQELLDNAGRPDAVFVTNHLMTIGALKLSSTRN